MEKIRILQIGTEDWKNKYSFPSYIKHIFADGEVKYKKEIYEIVVLERNLEPEEIKAVKDMSYSYCLFAVDSFELDENNGVLFEQRMGKLLPSYNIQDFINNEAKKYFSKPYGEKFNPGSVGIANGFKGQVKWNGQYSVSLDGDYGYDMKQIAFWRGNIPMEEGQAIDFWLEYKKDEGVEISLSIKQFVSGSLSDVLDSWEFSEEDLQNEVRIEGRNGAGTIFVSLRARGSGHLEIVGLHDRISRWDIGEFMVCVERYFTS